MKLFIYITMLTVLCSSVFADLTDDYKNMKYKIFKNDDYRLGSEDIKIDGIHMYKKLHDLGYFTCIHYNPGIKGNGSTWFTQGCFDTRGFTGPYGTIPGPQSKIRHKTIAAFDIDPGLINIKLPVVLKLSGNGVNPNQVEAESLALGFRAVPSPGAVLLGSIGCAIISFLKRRRSM